jgi:hypothetical protein
MTKQLGRAWRLGRDLAGVLRGLARTLGWALRTPADQPALGVLEGPPLARLGTPSAYRIRAYNPSPVPRSLHVLVIGWLDTATDVRFQLEWEAVLEPGAAAERWIRTDWRGAPVIVAERPGEVPIWDAGDVIGRWNIEARLGEDARSALHVSGALVG